MLPFQDGEYELRALFEQPIEKRYRNSNIIVYFHFQLDKLMFIPSMVLLCPEWLVSKPKYASLGHKFPALFSKDDIAIEYVPQ